MKGRILTLFILLSLLLNGYECPAQKIAVKTNLFYGAYTSTPNIGLEIGLTPRTTLDMGGGYNWFIPKSNTNNKKLVHWLASAEYRYWLCERFSGHFFGVHALGTQYNIAEHNLPLLFGDEAKLHRYEGWGAGAGISYGYQFIVGNRWSLEATIGVGYVRLHYDKFQYYACGGKVGTENRNYFGPTKAGITLVFLIK